MFKVAGNAHLRHRGPARVFDNEEAAFDAVQSQSIKPNDVVVIRYEGPSGGPGMREMLSVTSAIVGAGARRYGRAHHRRTLLGREPRLHRRPHRARSGARRPIALVRDGDIIVLDTRQARARRCESERQELTKRKAQWTAPKPRYTSGVMAKYARLVSSGVDRRGDGILS